MKKYINKIFIITAAVLVFTACKKQEDTISYLGGTNPVLTANISNSIPLSPSTKNDLAVSFSWTNPNYRFTDGISSQDVSYYVEIDTAADFSSGNMQQVGIRSSLTTSFTQNSIDSVLANGLKLTYGQTYNIQIRVVSYLGTNKAELMSNTLTFIVTPYAPPPKVTPPGTATAHYKDGKLFIVGGDVLLGAWSNPVPAAQQLIQDDSTHYHITIALSGGDNTNSNDQYLFIPVNGSWSNKYAGNNSLNPSATGGQFGYNWGDNFPGPVLPGNYLISVDFQFGVYTVAKQ